MTPEMQKQFMDDQIHEIEVAKWLASEKAGRDLGSGFVMTWIEVEAENYYHRWIIIHEVKNESTT